MANHPGESVYARDRDATEGGPYTTAAQVLVGLIELSAALNETAAEIEDRFRAVLREPVPEPSVAASPSPLEGHPPHVAALIDLRNGLTRAHDRLQDVRNRAVL